MVDCVSNGVSSNHEQTILELMIENCLVKNEEIVDYIVGKTQTFKKSIKSLNALYNLMCEMITNTLKDTKSV